MRETHDAASYAPEKDQTNFLKLQQIEAILAGIRVAPKQSAKHLRSQYDVQQSSKAHPSRNGLQR
jgi:hypothetical protein